MLSQPATRAKPDHRTIAGVARQVGRNNAGEDERAKPAHRIIAGVARHAGEAFSWENLKFVLHFASKMENCIGVETLLG